MSLQLVLVEFGENVRRLPLSAREAGERACVALSPAASVALEEAGIAHALVHEFISSARIQEELSGNWDVLHRLIELIDEHAPFGATAAYHLKLLIDSCAEKILQLTALLSAIKPSEVVAFRTRVSAPDDTLSFDERESLYARLLPSVLSVHGPEIGQMMLESAVSPRKTLVPTLRQWREEFRSRFRTTRYARTGSRLNGRSSLCVVEDGYGLGSAAERLAADVHLVRWAPTGPWSIPPAVGLRRAIGSTVRVAFRWRSRRRLGHQIWDAFRTDPRVHALLVCRGVGYFDAVAERLGHLCRRVLPQLPDIEEHARALFTHLPVRCLASVYFSRPQTYALARAARRHGLTVATLQHSAYGYWDWPIAKYIDGVMSDVKMVGGDGVARYVSEVERAGCRPVVTGLPMLDGLLRASRVEKAEHENRPEPPRVVYLLASYVRNSIHYSFSRLAVTEYFDLNRRILAVLGGATGVDVLVRPHPNKKFRTEAAALGAWLARRGWGHVRFEWDGSTTEVLRGASLVVIDSPSTVLLQAVAFPVKILVYNGIFRMTDWGRSALARRVTYSEDLQEFLRLLETTLRTQDFEPPSSEEFVRSFGTHLHDGRSHERVASALRSLVQEPPSP